MASSTTEKRVKRLEEHLRQENPVVASAVASFRKLDRVYRQLGLMDKDESLAIQVSWWPVVSIVGTFSAGKSTFINQYIGKELQRTGNQAVDDKFTVLCYGGEEHPTSLPGLALDSDPRFPFYQISREIEKVAEGEGRRVDSYLQLTTCKAEPLRGKILIDSPGFDADQQRTSTLLIVDHILDLSDLVLVFFDARHPEPGAMVDTLNHLVSNTVQRPDSNKFLFILNQIDNAAREDNSEDVVAAWQRALAQHQLTAGRFYSIYSRNSSLALDNEQVQQRLERKRDEDLGDIEARIHQVEVERAYRIIGVLEKKAKAIENTLVPALQVARRRWRKLTTWLSASVLGLVVAGCLYWSIAGGQWDGFSFTPVTQLDPALQAGVLSAAIIVLLFVHLQLRGLAGRRVLRKLEGSADSAEDHSVVKAFRHNLRAWWRPLAWDSPRSWNKRRQRQLNGVLADADSLVQSLNDRYATPSGKPEK